MIAIVVDDEKWALKSLSTTVGVCTGIERVEEFADCDDVISWAENNRFDIAFLDINMRGMGGIELAKKLRKINASCFIIFCTGYQEYAVEAFELHADGYVLKPVTQDRVQKEIEHLTGKKADDILLDIHCFGNFEVFAKGKPLPFKRSKSKELLAVLVKYRGAGVTAKELCAIIWENDSDGDQKNMAYLWNLFSDLKKTLAVVNAESVLVHNGVFYMLDVSKVKCDYYSYLDNPAESKYMGQFMAQYSWAESVGANL